MVDIQRDLPHGKEWRARSSDGHKEGSQSSNRASSDDESCANRHELISNNSESSLEVIACRSCCLQGMQEVGRRAWRDGIPAHQSPAIETQKFKIQNLGEYSSRHNSRRDYYIVPRWNEHWQVSLNERVRNMCVRAHNSLKQRNYGRGGRLIILIIYPRRRVVD